MKQPFTKKILSRYGALPKGLKASFWFTVSSLFQKGLAFIATPIYTRLLTQSEYGLFSVYNSWLSVLTIVATLNLSAGVLNNALLNKERFDCDDNQILSNFQFVEILTISFVMGIILLLKWLFPSFLSISFTMLMMMAITILFTSAVSLWSVKEKFKFHYRGVTIVSIVSSLVTIILNILFIKFGSNHEMAMIYGSTISTVVIYIVVMALNLFKGRSFFKIKLWKYAIIFNLPLIPHYLASVILASSDRIMIESFSGTSDAALYSVAYSIGSIILILVTAINSSLAPYIYQKIKSNDVRGLDKVANSSFVLLIGAAILLSFLGPELIYLMGGQAYINAKWVIPPVAGSIVFYFMYPLFANIEFYYEKRFVTMVSSCFAAVINVVLNLIFIPMFGYIAAAFTTLLCYALLAVTHFFAYKYVCKLKGLPSIYNNKWLTFFALSSLLIILISYLIYLNDYVRYGFLICLLLLLIISFKKMSNFVKNIFVKKKED